MRIFLFNIQLGVFSILYISHNCMKIVFYQQRSNIKKKKTEWIYKLVQQLGQFKVDYCIEYI